MHDAIYSFEEVEALLRITAHYLSDRGRTESRAMFARLAEFFHCEFAGLLTIESNSTCWALTLSNQPLECSQFDLQPGMSAVQAQLRSGRTRVCVTSSIGLFSAVGVDQTSVLVLCRSSGGFEEKQARTLAMIHSILLPRLVACMAKTSDLSPRLQQVQQGLLDGLSDKQIAFRLQISPNTIHVYVKDLFKRWKVSSRGELLSAFYRKYAPSIDWQGRNLGRPDQLPGGDVQLGLKHVPAAEPVSTIPRAASHMVFSEA